MDTAVSTLVGYISSFIKQQLQVSTYYDTQPLVYITEVNYNAGYFIGANMHYLNTKHREGIAKKLRINKSSTRCSSQTIHRYLLGSPVDS